MLPKLLVYLLCYTGVTVVAIWPPLHPPVSNIRRHIIKVRARGFMPFESDILLPLGILKHMQGQQRQRIARLIPSKGSTHQLLKPQFTQRQKYLVPTTKSTNTWRKNHLRLEPSSTKNNKNDIKKYNLYDDDGEFLLDVQFHEDHEGNANRRYYSTPCPLPLQDYHADPPQQLELQPKASTLNIMTSSSSLLASSESTSPTNTNQNPLRINLP